MADTGTVKSESGNLDAKEEQREEGRRTTERTEQQDLRQRMETEEEQREEGRRTYQRTEEQDLNQGMDTGTHDSIRHGVAWGSAYQVRSTTSRKRQKKGAVNTTTGK